MGQRAAATCWRWAVYTMNADGSGVVKLVDAAVQMSRWDYKRLSWTRN
jgi:hypothetical protein